MSGIRYLAGLVDVALWIYFWLMVMAVAVSWLTVSPFHPAQSVLRLLRKITDPVLDFFSHTLRLYRLKSPFVLPVAVLAVIFFLRIFLSQTISDAALLGNPVQFAQYVVSNFFFAALYTLYAGSNVYFWIVLIAVMLSWIPLDPYHPFTRPILRFLHDATEPVFRFFRRTLQLHRYTAPLDFTPMLVILAIYLLQSLFMQIMQKL